MTRASAALAACAFAIAIMAAPLRAQWVVYDPTNYVEAVAQYEQLLQQYRLLLAQARRVPVDIASRYHAHSLDWTYHTVGTQLFAEPILSALNTGDPRGVAYRRGGHNPPATPARARPNVAGNTPRRP